MATDIARLLQGDKDEWDEFVDRFTPVIWAAVKGSIFAHAGSVNEEDVRELVQSVFVRLVAREFRLLRTYDPARASLVTWLTIVARSAALSMLVTPNAASATIATVIAEASTARSTRCTLYPSNRLVRVKSISRRFS